MRSKAVAVVFLTLAAPALVCAQAWLPARGQGYVSLTYQSMFASDHLLSTGEVRYRGPVRFSTVTAGVLYGITDRLAVSAGIPYVASKFTLTPGLTPSVHDMLAKLDDGRYHGAVQDFRAAAYYNAVRGPLMVTPFFEVVIPTHHYETFGAAAPGKHLREYHVGTNVGRLLNPILPRAYFELRYTYSFVQKVAGFNLDRNNVDLEVGYFLTPSLALRAIGGVQKTLGGLEALVPSDSPFFPNHDRLERSHYSRVGGGATFSLRRNLDLYTLLVSTLSGRNIQALTALAVGVGWNFQTRKPTGNSGHSIAPGDGRAR